jgi:hypothetical protein
MYTIMASAASVTGAHHLRARRNGQDAAATWVGDGAAAVVVCDGCSAGTGSELGAALGAKLVARGLAARLAVGASPMAEVLWAEVRSEVAGVLATLVARLDGAALRDHFLFTIVAAAVTRDAAAVWMLGDGAFAHGDRVRVLGPFANNAPPYLAYDLIGEPRPAVLEPIDPACGALVIATDGGSELALSRFCARRYVEHPDALRRELAVMARGGERIDWDARRIARVPAVLQDDCAIGVVRWEPR